MTAIKMLFTPTKIGSMEVKNRIVLPAMSLDWVRHGNVISQRIVDYYEARARGGVGLIITGLSSVDPLMEGSPLIFGLWDDRFIAGFKELAKAVHAHGAKLAPQIMYGGLDRDPTLSGAQAVGPSPIPPKEAWLTGVPRELSIEEIEEIIEAFGEGARRAREAGCDAMEIHASHGNHHLVSSFLSPLSNKRTDTYGGSPEGRIKFALEIVKRMKAKAGSDFPIIMRMSADEIVPGGRSLLETQMIAPILAEGGVDAFNFSGGVYPDLSWWVVPPAGTPLGLNVDSAAAVRQAVDVPIIAAGRIKEPLMAEHILTLGKADLVAMGRALLADPELPNKAASGNFDDIAPCIGCNLGCTGGQKRMTCLVNPTLGKEKQMALSQAKTPKKVMIVGGGPAGLEAARVAALRGHQVALYEKTSKLGGQFNLASVPPLVQEYVLLIKYLSTQVRKAGVGIELGKEITPALIEDVKPDAVIIATGGAPIIPNDIPGIENEIVVTAHDVLAGKAAIGAKNIVVIGGDRVGCEVADFLADQGDNSLIGRIAVTIVGGRPDLAEDMMAEPRYLLLQDLRKKGVDWMAPAYVKEILGDGIVFVKDGKEGSISRVDCIVLALGATSVDDLSNAIQDKVAEVYVVGDAKEPRTALEAIAEAADVAREI